jgi:hypothetical protein
MDWPQEGRAVIGNTTSQPRAVTHTTGCGQQQRCQDFDQCRLSGPVRTEKTEELPIPDLEVYVIKRNYGLLLLVPPERPRQGFAFDSIPHGR